jgi:very-short-patch-repair endonuclease
MSLIIKQYIKYNRLNPTKCEKIFWHSVRNRQFLGLRFNRQYPIKYQWENIKRFFIADFYCAEKKTVIEIDGNSHLGKENYDQFRTHVIFYYKKDIIRFSNQDILYNLKTVMTTLESHLLTPPLCCISNREGAGG